MKDTKGSGARGVVLQHTMANKACTSLHWSPSGRFLLLAGLAVRACAGLGWLAGAHAAAECDASGRRPVQPAAAGHTRASYA